MIQLLFQLNDLSFKEFVNADNDVATSGFPGNQDL